MKEEAMQKLELKPKDITKEKVKELKKKDIKMVELYAISSNNYILGHSKVGHTFEELKKASKLIKRGRIDLGYKISVGFPDSTRLDELNTAKELVKFKPKYIKICPTLVTKKTIIEEMYNNGEYEPITLEQTIERCKELYYFFEKKHIETITIQNEKIKAKELIAGPYNEMIEQLVESRIWYDSIVNKIKKFNVKVKEVEIELNPRDVKHVIGYEDENLKKLKEFYEVDVKIVEDEKKTPGKFDIKILKIFSDFYDEKEESKKE